MTHYFTDNSSLDSDPVSFDYYLGNEKFVFTSDRGVFSKGKIDYGSYVLIKNVVPRSLGTEILDLGCGYGPIGIILKRFHEDANVTLVDVNPRAADLARRNAKENHEDVTVFVEEDIARLGITFDSVILNPPIRAGKETVFSLYRKAHETLRDGGDLYIVIQKKQGAESSRKYLETFFTEVQVLDHDGGYLVMKALK